MKIITKLSAMLLVAAFSAALPTMAQTTPAPATTNAPAARPARAPRYTGTIATIDSTNMVLTMKPTTRTPAFKVKITSSTKITKERQPAQFADLAVGLRVNGGGKKDDDGNWTATTLAIMVPRTTNAPPAAVKQN